MDEVKPRHRRTRETPYSEYHPHYADEAYKYCLLGATDEKLCEFFKISMSTLVRWKKANPDFAQALVDGKQKADAEIAHAFYQRAKGYSHPDVQFFNVGGEIVEQEFIKHYPPDVKACALWLANRRKEYWKMEEGKGNVTINVTLAEKVKEARQRHKNRLAQSAN